MNTRCGWGGVARTSRDPVWCNKSTVISLANRRGRVGCWTLERQCGPVPIHATTPRRPRAGDRVTSPVPVPTVPDRAGPLAALGWSGREAEWITLVALHSGAFTRSQFVAFFSRALACRGAPFCPRAHRQEARHRGRPGYLSGRRARRVAHGESDLSRAGHRRRTPQTRQRSHHARAAAPVARARLPHRAADPRMAPD